MFKVARQSSEYNLMSFDWIDEIRLDMIDHILNTYINK